MRTAVRVAGIICGLSFAASLSAAETLTLPRDRRPEWLRRDGIVMAGSWEPLMFRVRRDGAEGYTPTAQQRADYQREHTPEMLQRLKALGVNFVMFHCYKGAGMQAEQESMADAVRFGALCRQAGLHTGVYATSGTLMWELFFQERPDAREWPVRNAQGEPVTYGKAHYRYYWNRNHPAAEAYLQQVVKFAVNDIQVDLVHLDNYHVGPGWDDCSVGRFRQYLEQTFTPQQRAAMGVAELERVRPPLAEAPELLHYAWRDFCCASLAESFHRMTRFARALRPDVLMECNPAGIRPVTTPPVDHGRLLTGGEAFWDEGRRPGFQKNVLSSRIRTFKVARRMENSAFCYILNPLEAAESMAFNLDCLGAICWFEYDRLDNHPGTHNPIDPAIHPYVRFFHQRRELLRDATVVADVVVLRSFPSLVFARPQEALLTSQVEEALIADRVPFQIIYEGHLDDLRRYRAVVLAGCTALADTHVEQLRAYVKSGGRLCLIGPAATHDQWKQPRAKPALDDLPAAQAVRSDARGDWLAAIREASGGRQTLALQAPAGLYAELTEQPGRRLVHLVNYRQNEPAQDVAVRLCLPSQRKATSVTLASPGRQADLVVPFQQRADEVTFHVPEVGVYEIAVVQY